MPALHSGYFPPAALGDEALHVGQGNQLPKVVRGIKFLNGVAVHRDASSQSRILTGGPGQARMFRQIADMPGYRVTEESLIRR